MHSGMLKIDSGPIQKRSTTSLTNFKKSLKFMKSRLSGSCPGPLPNKEIASGNRIDTTNAFLDSFLSQYERKIAPESIEHTDFEISSFFWPIYTTFWQASLKQISPAPVLLLELRKALRVKSFPGTLECSRPLYNNPGSFLEASRKLSRKVENSWKARCFGVMPRTFPSVGISPRQ